MSLGAQSVKHVNDAETTKQTKQAIILINIFK